MGNGSGYRLGTCGEARLGVGTHTRIRSKTHSRPESPYANHFAAGDGSGTGSLPGVCARRRHYFSHRSVDCTGTA